MKIGKKACAGVAVAAALAASLLGQGHAKADDPGGNQLPRFPLVTNSYVPVQTGGTLATRATEVETLPMHLGPGRYIIDFLAAASPPYGGTGDDRVYPEFVVNGRTIYGTDRHLLTVTGAPLDPAYNYGTNARITVYHGATGVITTHGLDLEVYAWGHKADANGGTDCDDASGSYNLRDLLIYVSVLP